MTDKNFQNIAESNRAQQGQQPEVDILMATYNSSQYLAQAIESILHQNFEQWRLIISDGGSEDGTLDIIKHYTQQYPSKITFVPSERRYCASENYSVLMSQSLAPYIMFCDHDDVWLREKISKSLSFMKEAERTYGTDTPLLVFTDKLVVDESLNLISNSNFKYQNLNPKNVTLNRLLVQNVPSGCTMLLNRPLMRLCAPIPSETVMYDHWISLTAAVFGRIVCLNEPTLMYRQHSRNIFGASEYGWMYFCQRYKEGIWAIKDRFYRNVAQAAVFYERHKEHLTAEQDRILAGFSGLTGASWIHRRKVLLCNMIFKTGWRRNLGMMLIV
ncbi:MAG: glycosyltransferase family 2 protein [Phycisphaerae bacterium]|nr:glycosyltransferase family 2 protein [Phycisphaerae bacterium]